MPRSPHWSRTLRHATSLTLIAAWLGCSGAADESTVPRASAPVPIAKTPAAAMPPAASIHNAGAGLRRLTRTQYRNAIRTLFDLGTDELSLPTDGQLGPFASNTGLSLSVVQVDQYRAAARTVAEQVEKKTGLPDCQKDEESCVARFIDDLGLRAFRRPLEPPDRQDLLAIYKSAREGQTPMRGLALVVESILQAPAFLYVVERGETDGNLRRLDSFELATRLSLLFWNGPPDSVLLATAAKGELKSPDGLANWAAKLLADGRSASTVDTFTRGWLELGGLPTLTKDPKRYPFFDESIRRALERELFSFTDHVLRKSDARLSTLLSAPYSFLSAPLFRIYGLEPRMGEDIPVGLPPTERAGILTLPAVLATHAQGDITSPVHRGLMLLRSLLCRDLPPPPEGISITPLRPDPAGAPLSRRAQFEKHEADPQCGSCHRVMDPLGLAFESYDAVGAFRTTDLDYRVPVDPRVQIAVGSDIDGPVSNTVALIGKLAKSKDVRDCFATQWARFATGRALTAADDAWLGRLKNSFEKDGGNIRRLLLTLVTQPEFRLRGTN